MLSKPTEYFAENSKIRSIVISWFEGIFERKERKSRNTSNHLLLPSRNESQESSKNTLSTLPDPTSRDRGCRSKVMGAEQVDRLDRIRRERERGEGGIRVSRSTRIIGSVWKQANPLIETLPPPRRFNHLSRIPIYVTVIKGGGAQTSNPKFR